MPRFSLIVPAYNVEDYLEKCVDSIMCQSFSDFEVLIVDDGATDLTGKKADMLAEKHPEKLRVIHQQNKGLGGARNTGIEYSSGEYLWFIDSDDTISPDSLTEIDRVIKESEADIVVFDYAYTDDKGATLSTESGFNIKNSYATLESEPELLFMPNSACNKVYKKELFTDRRICFPERKWYEDLATILKIYPFAKKISYLNKTLYFYYQRQGSIMNNAKIARNAEIIEAVNTIREYYKNNSLDKKYREELEFLALKHVYIFASVRVAKADSSNKLLGDFRSYITTNYPDFKKNKYYSALSKKEKLIIELLEKRMYKSLALMLKVNTAIK